MLGNSQLHSVVGDFQVLVLIAFQCLINLVISVKIPLRLTRFGIDHGANAGAWHDYSFLSENKLTGKAVKRHIKGFERVLAVCKAAYAERQLRGNVAWKIGLEILKQGSVHSICERVCHIGIKHRQRHSVTRSIGVRRTKQKALHKDIIILDGMLLE